MTETNRDFEWRAVPGMVAERTRDLLKAGLGMVDVVEKQGERLVDALGSDRAAMVEDLQARGSRAIDDLQTEANRIFQGLVDRGEKLQKAGERRVEETVRTLSDRPRELLQTIEKTVEKAVGATMHRLDVPTRTEVERLSRRVERLTHEVERLASRMRADAEIGPVVFEVVAVQDAWMVRNVGTGQVVAEAGTKAEAVRVGREQAHAAAPAELRILKQDGTVQDTAHYA